MGGFFVNVVWLIPLLPLMAFAVIVLFTHRNPRLSAWVAIVAIALAMVISWGVIYEGIRLNITEQKFFHLEDPWLPLWFRSGVLDPLTLAMLLAVPLVCFFIFVYSVGYMEGEPRFARFFAYISLFAGGMLGTVLTDNFLSLVVFWEIMGLCSYLLIGFWFERPAAKRAALKAVLVTGLGDALMLTGILILSARAGTLYFSQAFRSATLHKLTLTTLTLPGGFSLSAATLVASLILAGAVGKSAQFPLHVWLPDAMEGPTPVSALIHAATMVAAGVYLLVRCRPLFVAAPSVLLAAAIIGGFTALFASLAAAAHHDFKRVLAYSTISQLGYMFLAAGVGSAAAATFHLATHAFFKALLFLCAGSVMHALGGQLDIRKMGGLRRKMPATFWTFVLGACALAGIPGFSGFFSKEAVLNAALEQPKVGFALWLVGLLTAGVTAFYAFRLVFAVFLGDPRDRDLWEHAHESPAVMVGPMVGLAFLATVGGILGLPHWLGGAVFERALGPLYRAFTGAGAAHPSAQLELLLALAATVVALLGVGAAWAVHSLAPERLLEWSPGLRGVRAFLAEGYKLDEFYLTVLGRPALFVNRVLTAAQTGSVRHYLAVLFAGVVILGCILLIAGV